MFFKERFESLASFQKIEVVLIVLMVYGGILYYVDNFKVFIDDTKKVKLHNLRSIDISQKMQKTSQNEALQFVQIRLSKMGIVNSSLVVQNKQLSLEFMDMYDKSMKVLLTLENHFRIKSLSIIPKDKQLKVQILLDTRYLFHKDIEIKNTLAFVNPFYIKKEPIKVKVKETQESFQIPNFQIDAILAEEVLIDQQWYSKGDLIENNRIIEIGTGKVLFENIAKKKQFYIKYKK